jgi:hypothetical protein
MYWERLRQHLDELKQSLVTFRETLKEVKVAVIDVAGILSLLLFLHRLYFGN